MVAHIVPGMARLLNGGAEAVVPRLLHGQEMVLPPQAVIAVQAGCHEVKEHIERQEQDQESKAEQEIELPQPSLFQNPRIPGDHGKVQTDEQKRHDPEHIPGLGKGFLFQKLPCGMGGGMPYGQDGQAAYHEPEQGAA